jgi:hypothetical protein
MENDKQQKVTQLETEIKRLEKEKVQIQEDCLHKETKVRFAEGTNTMKLYCKFCNKEVGYPNQDQINEFLG